MRLQPFKFRINKAACCDDCANKIAGHSVRATANLSARATRQNYEGRPHLIVPVVMLRETVINGAFVANDELIPESWNGVPVTVGHPLEGNEFTTANHPDTLSGYSIGRIFNAEMHGDLLRAEAWIDIQRAEKVMPGLVRALESGARMDVSTGYFSRQDEVSGTFHGRAYTKIHRDIKPDHLALLPNEQGACSWEDGCGVRVNKGKMAMQNATIKTTAKQLLTALVAALKPHAEGDDDRSAIIANLLADRRSPFTDDDAESLQAMSDETLARLDRQYLKTKLKGKTMTKNANDGEDDMEPVVNAEDLATLGLDEKTVARMVAAANAKDDEGDGENREPVVNAEDLKGLGYSETMIARMIAAAKNTKAAPKPKSKVAPLTGLSAEDNEALALVRTMRDEKRAGLIETITANSDMKADALKKLDTATLETIGGGIRPAPNFSGRPVAVAASKNGKDDEVAKGMQPGGLQAHFAKRAEDTAKSKTKEAH